MAKYYVGDHVSFDLMDPRAAKIMSGALPVVAGTVVALPSGNPNADYYSIELDMDSLPEEVLTLGIEQVQLVAPREIRGDLPGTFEREDVESWLEA